MQNSSILRQIFLQSLIGLFVAIFDDLKFLLLKFFLFLLGFDLESTPATVYGSDLLQLQGVIRNTLLAYFLEIEVVVLAHQVKERVGHGVLPRGSHQVLFC